MIGKMFYGYVYLFFVLWDMELQSIYLIKMSLLLLLGENGIGMERFLAFYLEFLVFFFLKGFSVKIIFLL